MTRNVGPEKDKQIEETMPQLIYYFNEGCVAKSHFPPLHCEQLSIYIVILEKSGIVLGSKLVVQF